jgi:hypothetical protein
MSTVLHSLRHDLLWFAGTSMFSDLGISFFFLFSLLCRNPDATWCENRMALGGTLFVNFFPSLGVALDQVILRPRFCIVPSRTVGRRLEFFCHGSIPMGI